ncbi:MAG: hypothetical protein KGL39_02650 [Patescibacteria group bacterium]|nr:hypothetical protein [Patescibacteria group bacterium]
MKKSNPKSTKQPEVQILRTAMLFGLTRRAWSNRCKVGNEKLKTEEAVENGALVLQQVTKRVNATKRLIACAEYDGIMAHLNETYSWCLARSMMATGVSRGVYFVRRDMVEAFEEHLEESRRMLREELLPLFVAAYPKAKEDAKRPVNDQDPDHGGLGSLYCEVDYPTVEELRQCFGIEHSWFALSVPDELPEEVRKKETDKLRETFERAQQECLYALREGFTGLVAHAIDRLKVPAGEKPKVFVADSMVGGFMEFFDTFRAKNLMDDAALEAVVGQAQEIVMQFAPNIQRVKGSINLRNDIAAKLGDVKSTLDGLLKDRPIRKFNFED